MIKLRNNHKGFTIIELMIATSVFSVVLMICTYGLLNISRTYYKGVTITRTQETARQIMNEVSEAIKYGGGGELAEFEKLSEQNQSQAYCIGGRRFSYLLDFQKMDSFSDMQDKETSKKVLRQDGNCGDNSGPMNMIDNNEEGRELMGERMQLATFEICGLGGEGCSPTNDGPYRITLRVVSGTDDLFEDNDINNSCKTGVAGGQFCAATELTTVVNRRVQ